ncbi:MAG: hypothetical protein QXF87_09915 [Thermofilaceae archaeon]
MKTVVIATCVLRRFYEEAAGVKLTARSPSPGRSATAGSPLPAVRSLREVRAGR